jgi:hypothetical protein
MGNQTAIAKGRVEVEAARGQARDGGDPSLGNPMEDMTIAARTALNATKNAGPLVAERVKDAERLLNDVMAFEQTADRISRAVEQGDMDRDQARRQADRELRKAASRIRGRWDQLTKRTQGLPQVLGMRAFPDPGRDATSAEVKADIERKLAKANTATDLIPAMTDLARQAIGRGDMAVASQLAGDFGQTLIDNAMADAPDQDRRDTIAEVRGAIIQDAASSGSLTDSQASAIGQLQRMDDLNDAVTSAVFVATMRFDDAFARLPWAEGGERAQAEGDPDRYPFVRGPMAK